MTANSLQTNSVCDGEGTHTMSRQGFFLEREITEKSQLLQKSRCLVSWLARQLVTPKHSAGGGEEDNLKNKGKK